MLHLLFFLLILLLFLLHLLFQQKSIAGTIRYSNRASPSLLGLSGVLLPATIMRAVVQCFSGKRKPFPCPSGHGQQCRPLLHQKNKCSACRESKARAELQEMLSRFGSFCGERRGTESSFQVDDLSSKLVIARNQTSFKMQRKCGVIWSRWAVHGAMDTMGERLG